MTKKAERATFFIGAIEMSVYQMPNGEYRLAGRNVTDAVNEAANSLLRKLGVKSLKALPGADLSLLHGTIRAETGEDFIPVALSDAVRYWRMMDKAGNKLAEALLDALAIESLERRADAAFGVKRSEEERNERVKARLQGIATRRRFTDALRDWGIRNDVKPNYGKYTAMLIQYLGFSFGRDNKSIDELREIDFAERALVKYIDNGLSPDAAIRKFKQDF